MYQLTGLRDAQIAGKTLFPLFLGLSLEEITFELVGRVKMIILTNVGWHHPIH